MAQVVLDSVERIVLHVNSGERSTEETLLLALRSEGGRRNDANGAMGPMGSLGVVLQEPIFFWGVL